MGCYKGITFCICIWLAFNAYGISKWVAWSMKDYREVVGIVVESKTCYNACSGNKGNRFDGAQLTVTYEIDRDMFTFESDCICFFERIGEQMKLYYPSSDLSDATYTTWKDDDAVLILWIFSVHSVPLVLWCLLCAFNCHYEHYISQKALPPLGLLCMTLFFSAAFVFLLILTIMMSPFY
jgi:hypothetical protein